MAVLTYKFQIKFQPNLSPNWKVDFNSTLVDIIIKPCSECGALDGNRLYHLTQYNNGETETRAKVLEIQEILRTGVDVRKMATYILVLLMGIQNKTWICTSSFISKKPMKMINVYLCYYILYNKLLNNKFTRQNKNTAD